MKELKNLIIQKLDEFLNGQYSEQYIYEIYDQDLIEAWAYNKSDEKDKICLIRIDVNERNTQIYIPNIFVPVPLEGCGIGKKMILIVYSLGGLMGYETYVTDLTDGFRERLLKRGAGPTDVYDILQITENTALL